MRFGFGKIATGLCWLLLLPGCFSSPMNFPLITDPALNLCITGKCEPAPIRQMGYVISRPGKYYLKEGLATNQYDAVGIFIKSDNVTLDLNGQVLRGTYGPGSYSLGIISYGGYKNIQIKNGTIDGFQTGIYVSPGSENIVIEDLTITNSWYGGINSYGLNTRISNNRILNTGGTTIKDHHFSVAIQSHNYGCLIEDNIVTDFYPTGDVEAIGISISGKGNNCVVRGNQINNSHHTTHGKSLGIWVGGSPDESKNIALGNNAIDQVTYGFVGSSTVEAELVGNQTTHSECLSVNFNGQYRLQENEFDSPVNSTPNLDCTDTLDYWQPLALQGDPTGMFRFGMVIENNLSSKYYWLARSGDAGHSEGARAAARLKEVYPWIAE